MCGSLFVMGSWVVCAWCSCYVGEWCISRVVLLLFYPCAFQMNPLCVVCMVTSD